MYNNSEILEMFEIEQNITNTAKKYCQKHGLEYDDKLRRKFSRIINSNPEQLTDRDTESETEPRKIMTALDDSGRVMDIDKYCEYYGLDRGSIVSYKLVSHTGSPYYNISFRESNTAVENVLNDTEFLDELIQKYIQPIKADLDTVDHPDTVDRLILSDIHIGMNNHGNSNTVPLFKNPLYDSQEIFYRQQTCIRNVLNYQTSDTLYIDTLGDLMDGLGGQTTRGGHLLPQLMSDKQAFETALDFIVSLITQLLESYQNIVCNNVINDNHSFMMGYFVHSAAKKILETKYPGRVQYVLHERFISHYSVGQNTFILCHGKDSQDMKHGLKLYLDDKITSKIDQYCKEYRLYDGRNIEFSKGDLHQHVIDTTGPDFEYVNYPSFSPPSSWVQTNFGNSRSGFVIQNISLNTGIKTTTPVWF